jgi:transposase-like protein
MPRRARHTGRKPPFRLSRKARTCDFAWLESLTEKDAYNLFVKLRWHDNDGKPYCPECGSLRCRQIKTRPRWWYCIEKGCKKHFSVTSGTIFHSRQLSFLKLLKLVFKFANAPKGVSAVKMHLEIDCQYKSTYVNMQKLRQAMGAERDSIWLSEKIEVDGAYFGGKEKPANMKKDRIDRRKKKRTKEDKGRCMMVFKERYGKAVAFATEAETKPVVVAAARALVIPAKDTVFYTDGHAAYEDLEAFGQLRAGDHGKGYSVNGVSTNLAESFFSRARRGEYGSYHHLSATWLDLYACEMTWRENNRRVGNRQTMERLLKLALSHKVSRILKGYWQHWELPDDELERKELRWGRVFAPLWNGDPPENACLAA